MHSRYSPCCVLCFSQLRMCCQQEACMGEYARLSQLTCLHVGFSSRAISEMGAPGLAMSRCHIFSTYIGKVIFDRRQLLRECFRRREHANPVIVAGLTAEHAVLHTYPSVVGFDRGDIHLDCTLAILAISHMLHVNGREW